jgi:OOP family OmpA-OmpF porin
VQKVQRFQPTLIPRIKSSGLHFRGDWLKRKGDFMAESLFRSLLSTLERDSTIRVAQAIGEQQESVSRGLESSIATILAGMSTKVHEPGTLRRILDLMPWTSGNWSELAGEATKANSTLISGGRRILASLFGSAEAPITSAISHDAGLGAGSASTLLALTAPVVSGFLSRKIRDQDMTFNGLATRLACETGAIRRAVPSAAADMIWRRPDVSMQTPVIVQSIRSERSAPFAGVLALSALALGVFWLVSHNRPREIASMGTGFASRLINETASPPLAPPQDTPPLDLKIPEDAGEDRLMSFVQDKSALVSGTTWFDFQRLRFNSGSAELAPGSAEQLDDIAGIFRAYPELRGTLSGYTDDQGDVEMNSRLSKARADAVKTELVKRGVTDTRLATHGMGEQDPIADNSTEAGRADNRRVALQITNK